MQSRADLSRARRIVVKVGTRAVLDGSQGVDRAALGRRLQELILARKEGRFVVLVSSGAIGLGWGRLGFKRRPTTMPELQASASVGQNHLMRAIDELLGPSGVSSAQLLLTHDDFSDRRRYLNLRNALAALHEAGALPVINENDVVSVDEIRFGDNDILAALTANAVDADLTVLFSNVPGVLDASGKKLDVVKNLSEADGLARKGGGAGLGSGGMKSKLEAARRITAAGGALVVAHGKEDSLEDILAGRPVGTLFLPRRDRMEHRKRWIAFTAKEAGTLEVDAGAEAAILLKGKSLLPAGITGCTGRFDVGDAVVVRAGARAIAKGLTNYSAGEVRKIMGRRTQEIEALLGRKEYEEVIHRDNLVSLVGE